MSIKIVIVFTSLILFAGMANGITDTLQFHFPTSFAAEYDAEFWNPDVSWRNKYAKDDQGALLMPLKPRYFGSTTFLVFTTDAWHLFKFLHYALMRITLCIALMMYVSNIYNPTEAWKRVAIFAGMYVGLWGVRSIGFHVFYTLL